jgi:hypothetical protein
MRYRLLMLGMPPVALEMMFFPPPRGLVLRVSQHCIEPERAQGSG